MPPSSSAPSALGGGEAVAVELAAGARGDVRGPGLPVPRGDDADRGRVGRRARDSQAHDEPEPAHQRRVVAEGADRLVEVELRLGRRARRQGLGAVIEALHAGEVEARVPGGERVGHVADGGRRREHLGGGDLRVDRRDRRRHDRGERRLGAVRRGMDDARDLHLRRRRVRRRAGWRRQRRHAEQAAQPVAEPAQQPHRSGEAALGLRRRRRRDIGPRQVRGVARRRPALLGDAHVGDRPERHPEVVEVVAPGRRGRVLLADVAVEVAQVRGHEPGREGVDRELAEVLERPRAHERGRAEEVVPGIVVERGRDDLGRMAGAVVELDLEGQVLVDRLRPVLELSELGERVAVHRRVDAQPRGDEDVELQLGRIGPARQRRPHDLLVRHRPRSSRATGAR